ncbi:MAG: PQQ-dependent sugar dehydrogenase [Gemmatimonadota bacterium]
MDKLSSHSLIRAASLLTFLAACGGTGAAQPRAAHLTDSTYGGQLWVPGGLVVTEFARVPRARFMALAPDGSVWVSQPSSQQVVRLVDANRDGVAERQAVALSGLDRPHGLAFRDGWLYIANTGAVVRVRIGPDGLPVGEPQHVVSYSTGGGHWTRTVIFGVDGGMYVSIGSTCNVCVERTPDRAAVMRYDADGRNGRVFSSGLRNAVGLAVHPATGEIWVTQHERDNLRPSHEDLPPEEINILRDGAHFGWPWCHSDRVPTPDESVHDPSRCPSTIPPALALQAHSAPLGITFLNRASLLPADLRGDAVVAYHGSWNRTVPTGAKVVRIRVADGKPQGVEDFIVGWQDASGRRWGRPVDVLVAADGALLVSDDQAGIIYRVSGRRR